MMQFAISMMSYFIILLVHRNRCGASSGYRTSLAAVPSNLSCTIKMPRYILWYANDWIVCHIKNFQTLELDDVLWNFFQRVSTEVEDLQMWKLEDGAGQLVQLIFGQNQRTKFAAVFLQYSAEPTHARIANLREPKRNKTY